MDAPLTYLLLAVIGFASYMAFHQPTVHARLAFDSVLVRNRREYSRYLTSALVHLDLSHLLMNLVGIYLFGRWLEAILGPGPLLAIFAVGTIAGNVVALATHRAPFRAAGASAGGAAIIFAMVLLDPMASIRPFLLPFGMPCWLWAAIYLGASIYALHRRDDGIGHDAHLGGALGGLVVGALFRPAAAVSHAWVFLLLLAVAVAMRIALSPRRGRRSQGMRKIRRIRSRGSGLAPRTNEGPAGIPSPRKEAILEEARAIDGILEKISKQGLHSITPEERSALERFSQRRRARRPSTST
jgi:membrane associated rhomboid family serine protease